ncbi:MAG: hypothetical protein Fur002_17950 [Anaerolineales bacterium]
MKELMEYRQKLLARLDSSATAFVAACRARGASAGTDGAWTIRQLAAHTRDVELFVYGMRIEKTLREDNPLFPNFDADTWMAEHDQPDEPLEQILSQFLAHVQALCQTLRAAPPEAWSRVSRHEAQGGDLTLQLWVERSLAHIEEHLRSASNPPKAL